MLPSVQKNISPRKLLEHMLILHYRSIGWTEAAIAKRIGIARQTVNYSVVSNSEYQVHNLPLQLLRIAEYAKTEDEHMALQAASIIIQRLIEEVKLYCDVTVRNVEKKLLDKPLVIRDYVKKAGVL